MSLFASPNWSEMFSLSVPPLEILIRGTAMYWFIFILLRLAGRRDIGTMGVADLLVVVLIADAAQNGMAGEYRSVTNGMILVGTIVGWTVTVDRLVYRFPALASLLVVDQVCLVRDGVLLRHQLRREAITEKELMSELRLKGIESLRQVRRAYIEPDGNISVLRARSDEPRDDSSPP
jgi:uncharacterized membrane protein YcaP (DUF421 family)